MSSTFLRIQFKLSCDISFVDPHMEESQEGPVDVSWNVLQVHMYES